MLHHIKTFGGHNINDGSNYQAILLNPHGSPPAKPVFLEQVNADAIDAGVFTTDVQNKVVQIEIRNWANRRALIARLKTWFERGTQGELVATFTDDGTDYQLSCRVVNLVQETDKPMVFTVLLQTGQSAWRAVQETIEDTWSVDTSTDTLAIDVAGTDETFLSVDLTAVEGPEDGWLYQNIYQLPNTPGIAHGRIPWCITVDTASLISAGKMQDDCDDLRIVDMNTGKELKRWISNPNNAATKVWINIRLDEGFALVLGTAIADTGVVSSIQFQQNDTMRARIARMPKQGIIYHGNEWFRYTDTDPVNCRLTISTRALFGTTMEAHSSGVTFLYIQNPLLMRYGNTVIGDPADDDDRYDDDKPLINLSSSSNTSWVWDSSTKFRDPAHPNRTASWTFVRQALGPLSKIFHIKRDASSGDPAMGLLVAAWQSGSIWKDEDVYMYWQFVRTAEIDSVASVSGEKYRSNDYFVRLAQIVTGELQQLLLITPPSAEDTWESYSGSSLDLPAASITPEGRNTVMFRVIGGYRGAAEGFMAVQVLAITLNFKSANIPTGTFLGEEDNYPLEITLRNAKTGDAISLNYMMRLDTTFSVDGERKTVEYDGLSVHSSLELDNESRAAYIRLTGGEENTIEISGVGGVLDVALRYYARRL